MIKIIRPLHRIIRWLLLGLVVVLLIAIIMGKQIELVGLDELSLLLGVLIIYIAFEFVCLYADYRQHKKPLKAVDPEVDYTLLHHIRQVTFPTLRYRWSTAFH